MRIEQQKAARWIMLILNRKLGTVTVTKNKQRPTSCKYCKIKARTRQVFALKARLRGTNMRKNLPR
eukprot:4513629-Heterocapsa_arctica.AAC.1